MVPILFAAFLALAVMVSVADWRRGVLMMIVIGVIQDPARKLTAGAPVALSMSVIVVYLAIILAAQGRLQRSLADFARRFAGVWAAFGLAFFFLLLAAINGLLRKGSRSGAFRWSASSSILHR